ncbi:fungal-specific transcription factor domain-containing protein [Parachaetomium inaequale]|uniref:Fungal-specific transcription factor domain-containing protein n=1 Tax=Parachaetomium inaequale TaxID=2588326 RepID=A0AAN6PIZ8_9PEZI|nr:fungal-specific transcription factor domain-containing protein [Parachaetomium inaequale]
MDSVVVPQKRARERDQGCDPEHETGPQHQGEEREQQRRRARLSCNTCKARKTKAKTGACQYCRTLGIPCEADPKSRKRPFYRVSGEVYEHSIKLLRRFVPEESLPELTVDNIQAILRKLDSGANHTPETPAPRAAALPPALPPGDDEAGLVPGDPVGSNDVMEACEHPLLQEELGCLLLDSMGKYRYVGADSSIRWNHAARMARGRPPHADPKIISPLKAGLLPPTSPESPDGRCREEAYLPPRQLCMAYVARFFDQIHCIYWFYSAEQFHTRLHHTYDTSGTKASSSWLCSLYSIFAMGSMPSAHSDVGRARNAVQDSKTSLDYLSMAKSLSPAATDEADVDSIKAFGLLSLATHAMCYSVTAYLHLGTAVRIGFSLGLHRDVSLRNKDALEWERGRRLWWTIYVLDYEMASRFGYPCSITESSVFTTTPPATEQILSPGPNTPLGYQALLVSLIQLRKKISHECFLRPAHVGGRLPISSVTSCLGSLRHWLDNMPTHLRWDSSLHPQHRRAVSLLHLRFWTAIISLTRPFLLFMVAKSTDGMIPVKRHIYEQMSNSCIEAAESGVQVVKSMREDKTLSSLMLLDCHCIGEIMWILILALQKRGGRERQDLLRFCLETLKTMDKVGWCEKVAPELEARVHESGVLELAALQLVQPPHTLWQADRAEGLPNQVTVDNTVPVAMQASQGLPTGSNPDYVGWNLDGSQFDVFETLDLDNRSDRLDMFMDASFLGSQVLFDDLGYNT